MINAVQHYFFQKFRASQVKSHPLTYLFWECTTRCNLNCLHCGSDCSKNSTLPDMPLPDFLSALDTIKNPAPHFIVVLTGGEPLLRSDLETCGREIRKRGMRWSMVTNGFHYTAERQKSLLNAGLGALTISLDGLQETHNWLRNHPESFTRAAKAVELAAKTERLNFDVVTCVNKRNFCELTEIKKLLESLHVPSWRLFTIAPIGRAKSNRELFLSAAQFTGLMNFISDSRKKGKMEVKFSCEGFVGKYETKVRDGFFFCRAGINIGSVLADGSISACPNIDRSFAQGNIYSDNFYETWQNRFEPFRNRDWARTGKCAECGEFSRCNGNGLHLWHGTRQNVLVCHKSKIIAE